MVEFPLPITTELWLDGAWVDISDDVRNTDTMSIKRGRADEAGTADPSKLSLKLDNWNGRYSPRNPHSPYYGQLRRNTPIRVRLGDLPEPEDPVLTDTFDRSETDGWGTADSGQEWSVVQGDAGDFSVSGGAGRIALDDDTANGLSATDTGLQGDVDIEVAVSISGLVQGDIASAVAFQVQREYGAETVAADVSFRVRTGTTADLGPVSMQVVSSAGQSTDIEYASALSYGPDSVIRARVQMVGPQIRIRAWADGEAEPGVWDAQLHAGTEGSGGDSVTVFAGATGGVDLSTPVSVACHEITVRPYSAPSPAVRYVGEVAAWPPRWDVSDTDVWVPLKAAGIRRRLSQGVAPAQSTLRRLYTNRFPPAYWPLEDGRDTTRAASGVGGEPMRVEGMTFGEDAPLALGGPMAELGPSARMTASGLPVVYTGSWAVEMLLHLTESDAPDEDGQVEELLRFTVAGGIAAEYVWTLEYTDADGLLHRVQALDNEGVQLSERFVFAETEILLDRLVQIRVQARQSGSDVEWESRVFAIFGGNSGGTTTHIGPVGHPAGIATSFGSGLEGMTVGHVAVWGGWDPVILGRVDISRSVLAGQRAVRLASSEGVPLLLEGGTTELMGVHPVAPLLELLDACAAADLGALTEQRSQLGLRLRTRSTLYNQTPALVLDYANGEIAPSIEPTDDDQATVNDVTVSRENGSEARVVDEDGPLGVESIGRYDDSVTLNVASDEQLDDQAGWRLHLGTVDELRIPTLTLNLRNPRLAQHHDAVLALDTGDRIQVLNPPIWVGGDTLDLIVQGYEETLSLFQWTMTLNCTPASAWTVGTVTPLDEVAEDFEDDDFNVTITDADGSPDWARTDTDANTGTWSFAAEDVFESTTDVDIAVPDGARALSFWWRRDSGTGTLSVYVDGDEVAELFHSPSDPWEQQTIDVTGATTVTFSHFSGTANTASSFIDDLVVSVAAAEPDQPDRADTDGSELVADVSVADPGGAVEAHSPEKFWRLDETGGTTFSDDGSNGDTASITGSVNLAGDTFNEEPAAVFTGGRAVSSEDPYVPGNQDTIMFWAKVESGDLVAHMTPVAAGSNSWDFRFSSTQQIRCHRVTTTTNRNIDITPDSPLDDGQWHHYAVVFDADNGFLRGFFDGQFENSVTWTPGETPDVLSSALTIGSSDDSGSRPFQGSIAQVGVIAGTLADSDIEAVYNAAFTDTSFDVATAQGPLWTTEAAEFPLDIKVGGEVMRVTGISGGSSPQTFTVERSINGIEKSHDAGADIRLAHPAIVAL